jgi:hypothetical protein
MTTQYFFLWVSIITALCVLFSLAIVHLGRYTLRKLELREQRVLEENRNRYAREAQEERNKHELALLNKKHDLEK